MNRWLTAIFVVMIIMVWGVSPVEAAHGDGRARGESSYKGGRTAKSGKKKISSVQSNTRKHRTETRYAEARRYDVPSGDSIEAPTADQTQ